MPVVKAPLSPFERLMRWAKLRHFAYLRRKRGEPKPWTSDPIIQGFRFCNVYRELDRETVWLTEHWREPHGDDPDLWFAVVVARCFVNWSEALDELGYPVPFDADRFVEVMEGRLQRKCKTYNTGAYRTYTASGSKPALHARLLTKIWDDRKSLRRIVAGTLANAHKRLMEQEGIGSFLAAQVVADLKYVQPLKNASDWWTFAAPGPGSQRGLNRVLGRDPGRSWHPYDWFNALTELRAEFLSNWPPNFPAIHAQDVQNCLCEFDKSERARLGDTKGLRKYPGLPDQSNGRNRRTQKR